MINWLLSYIVNNEKLAFFHKNARTSKFCDRFVRLLHCVSGQSVLSLLQLRNFPPGLINLSTDAFKGTSYKVNCYLQPNDCTSWAGMKYERSTTCLVYSTRCRPGIMHAGIILLSLLRCTSVQGTDLRVSSVMSVYVFSIFLHRGAT